MNKLEKNFLHLTIPHYQNQMENVKLRKKRLSLTIRLSTLVSGMKRVVKMVKVSKYGLMDLYTKVTGKTTKRTAVVV